MGLWGTVRREAGGLLRSVGYDLRRRMDAVWSRSDAAYPEYDAYARKPRRVMLVSGVVAVAAIGVVGTYMVLAGGLGTWLLGDNKAPDHAAPPAAGTVTSAAHGPAARQNKPPKPATGPTGSPAPAGAPKSSGQTRGTQAPSGSAHPGAPKPSSHPTAPPESTPTPAPTPSATPSPAPTPSDTPSPTPPDPSPSSDGSQQADIQPIDLSRPQSTSMPTGA